MSNFLHLTPEETTEFWFSGCRPYLSIKKAIQHARGPLLGYRIVDGRWGKQRKYVWGKADIWKVTLTWEKVQDAEPEPENAHERLIED